MAISASEAHKNLLLDRALAAILPLVQEGRRVVVGITGPPAAGKSTLSELVAQALRERRGPDGAVAVPMDGFHLANSQLADLGLANRKGAPETFDADGFLHLLRRIRARPPRTIYAPRYSRELNESIAGAIPIQPDTDIILVEGNYLLLPQTPWSDAATLLDLVIYVDAPEEERITELIKRQLRKGLDQDAALAWVHNSDQANARLIMQTRSAANVVLHRGADSLWQPDPGPARPTGGAR
jgi:pantothenate kinase